MKRLKPRSRPRPSRRSKVAPPRTAAQYHAKPEKFKNTWERIIGVISKMRAEKTSLQKAAKEQGVSPRTVKRWAGSALQKHSNGKWGAKKSDRLLRVLKIPSTDGPREVAVRGSKRASVLAQYWSALERYFQMGDAARLEKFHGKTIKAADGTEIPLLTDRAQLNHLGSAGVLSFESLYSRSA